MLTKDEEALARVGDSLASQVESLRHQLARVRRDLIRHYPSPGSHPALYADWDNARRWLDDANGFMASAESAFLNHGQ